MPIIKSAGLPLAGGTMSGDVVFADNISVLLGTGSDGNLYHDGTNTYFKNVTGHIYIENDAVDGDIIFKVNDGGVDTTVMTLDGATGNVGIGTTSPLNKLHIVNGTQIEGGVGNSLIIDKTGSANTKRFGLFVGDGTGGTTADENYIKSLNTDLHFIAGATGVTETVTFLSTGNVGIGTTAPTNILSVGGNSARIWWLERHTTANTAGNTLTVTAGGATAGATDKAGGNLILQGGLSTGSAESGVIIQGVVAGATGTADRTQTTAIQVLGDRIGFFAQTPVVRQTELTDELTAPGTLGRLARTAWSFR